MLTHPSGLSQESKFWPLGGAAPSNFYSHYNSINCLSSQTWGIGRPLVLSLKCTTFEIFAFDKYRGHATRVMITQSQWKWPSDRMHDFILINMDERTDGRTSDTQKFFAACFDMYNVSGTKNWKSVIPLHRCIGCQSQPHYVKHHLWDNGLGIVYVTLNSQSRSFKVISHATQYQMQAHMQLYISTGYWQCLYIASFHCWFLCQNKVFPYPTPISRGILVWFSLKRSVLFHPVARPS